MKAYERADTLDLYRVVAGPPPVDISVFASNSDKKFGHRDNRADFMADSLNPLFQAKGMFNWLDRVSKAGLPLPTQLKDSVENVLNSLLFESPFFGMKSRDYSSKSGVVNPRIWETHNHAGINTEIRFARPIMGIIDPITVTNGTALDDSESTFNLVAWDMIAQGAKLIGPEAASSLITKILRLDSYSANWSDFIYAESFLQIDHLISAFDPPLQLSGEQRERLGDALAKYHKRYDNWDMFYRYVDKAEQSKFKIVNEAVLSMLNPDNQEMSDYNDTPFEVRQRLATQYQEIYSNYYNELKHFKLSETIQRVTGSPRLLIPRAIKELPDTFFNATKDGNRYQEGIYNWLGMDSDAEKQYGTFLLSLPLLSLKWNDGANHFGNDYIKGNLKLLNKVRHVMIGKITPRNIGLIEGAVAQVLQVESIDEFVRTVPFMTPNEVVHIIETRANELNIGLEMSSGKHPPMTEEESKQLERAFQLQLQTA